MYCRFLNATILVYPVSLSLFFFFSANLVPSKVFKSILPLILSSVLLLIPRTIWFYSNSLPKMEFLSLNSATKPHSQSFYKNISILRDIRPHIIMYYFDSSMSPFMNHYLAVLVSLYKNLTSGYMSL